MTGVKMEIQTGLHYKEGSPVLIEDTIVVYEISDGSKMTNLFSKKIIDKVLVKFEKHEKFFGMKLTMYPYLNNKQITKKEYFEISDEEFKLCNEPRLLNPYIDKATLISYKFLEAIQNGKFEKYE
jgi:hypothetical protein